MGLDPRAAEEFEEVFMELKERGKAILKSTRDVFRMKELFNQLVQGGKAFWTDLHRAFLDRDLNRRQVQRLILIGLDNNV